VPPLKPFATSYNSLIALTFSSIHLLEWTRIANMPGLIPLHKNTAVSLVYDQDIFIVDADKADLTITIIGTSEKDNVKRVADVLVSSSICKQSRFLQSMIEASDDPSEITLGGELKRTSSNKHGQNHGENREGLLVMLAHLHGLTEQRMEELGLYTISILGVWFAIAYTERSQHESAKDTLKTWFTKWYATSMEGTDLDISSARGLAFPCQLFHHVAAYARVTKWLAYNHVGAVKDVPPYGFKRQPGVHLQIGDFFGMSTPIAHIATVTNIQTGPVNHARGGLKTTLHKSLYKKCGHLLRNGTDDCNCWDATVGQYFFALTKIDVFPSASESSSTTTCLSVAAAGAWIGRRWFSRPKPIPKATLTACASIAWTVLRRPASSRMLSTGMRTSALVVNSTPSAASTTISHRGMFRGRDARMFVRKSCAARICMRRRLEDGYSWREVLGRYVEYLSKASVECMGMGQRFHRVLALGSLPVVLRCSSHTESHQLFEQAQQWKTNLA
jgi:hypothetical protein